MRCLGSDRGVHGGRHAVPFVLFRIVPTFGDSKESAVLEAILEALMNQDSDELTRLCSDHVIKSLDTSVGGVQEDV